MLKVYSAYIKYQVKLKTCCGFHLKLSKVGCANSFGDYERELFIQKDSAPSRQNAQSRRVTTSRFWMPNNGRDAAVRTMGLAFGVELDEVNWLIQSASTILASDTALAVARGIACQNGEIQVLVTSHPILLG